MFAFPAHFDPDFLTDPDRLGIDMGLISQKHRRLVGAAIFVKDVDADHLRRQIGKRLSGTQPNFQIGVLVTWHVRTAVS